MSFAGQTLPPGRHEVDAGEIAATMIVGERAGPRAVVLGGSAAGDTLGLATVRRLLERLEGVPVAGSLVLAPRGAGRGRGALLAGAAFTVELRAGPAGWLTAAHLRAHLGSPRARLLARAFGAEILVDGRGGLTTLRYEAGELGRVDAAAADAAADGLFELLAARGVLEGARRRPPERRLLVDEIKRVRLRRGGTVVPLCLPGTILPVGAPLLALCDERGRERAIVTASHRCVLLASAGAALLPPRGVAARIGRVRSATGARVTTVAGWSERVGLPELGIGSLAAKLDTGARTSALHVLAMSAAGDGFLDITLPVRRAAKVRVAIVDHVVVRDSGGHAERRPVVETTLVIGAIRRRVRVTLTDRGDMTFPMLVGRSALAGVLVDPARRDLLDGTG